MSVNRSGKILSRIILISQPSLNIRQSALDELRVAFNLIEPLDDRAWAEARDLFELKTYVKKQQIFALGEQGDQVRFLISGFARYYFLSPEGKERNKSFAKPFCAITSLPSLIDASAATFAAQALSNCVCLSISYRQLKQLNNRHNSWANLCLRIFEKLALEKDVRIAELLMCSATERYLIFLQEYDQLVEQIPNYQIASYLGITEVALSRIRNKLSSL
ncbi:MAG: Crp/Fnr family transcriptional regulator [Pseudomonadales bacterium]|nr:Crp/Fnr family transcriptional regulator [Pseudomonadales bacterium]NRA14594.1 Crp/Fnr family transcriptional regulator [Oceanospirillaceae bacterium]